MDKRSISLKGVDQLQLLGAEDAYLRLIESAFQARIVVRGDALTLAGASDEIDILQKVFTELIFLVHRNGRLSQHEVQTVIDMVKSGEGEVSKSVGEDNNIVFYGKKDVFFTESFDGI